MNHSESVCSLEHYGGDSFDSALGVCRLEDLTPYGHFDDYMQPELGLAGVVAECILTRENFYDVWWSHNLEGHTDFCYFMERCEKWDIEVYAQMDEMVERTFALLVARRVAWRKVAKELMRCKCLFSYRVRG
ncbi:MAG: hypothetical protein KF857_08505 [Fimbriimonadaceae bacterium]|nr:hypothetical protein [Fimbriimonadaceae bacterium]